MGGFFCAVWAVCLASSRCARFVRLRVKQLEACVSKSWRATYRKIRQLARSKSGKLRLNFWGKLGLDWDICVAGQSSFPLVGQKRIPSASSISRIYGKGHRIWAFYWCGNQLSLIKLGVHYGCLFYNCLHMNVYMISYSWTGENYVNKPTQLHL